MTSDYQIPIYADDGEIKRDKSGNIVFEKYNLMEIGNTLELDEVVESIYSNSYKITKK